MFDTATLSGATSNAGGTVTYYVKRQTSATLDCSTTGATNLGTFNVTNGSIPPSNQFTIPSAGTFEFWAVYSGDDNNNGRTSSCGTETVKVSVHPGTLGFWRNWRNHYTPTQFQLLINYLMTNNPKVYNANTAVMTDDLTSAKVDAIFTFGNGVPRDQMILAQLTAAKFNLAITQLQGTGGLVQKNDNICLAGTVDVSSISGAAALFGTSTPTIKQIVDLVEGRWTGSLDRQQERLEVQRHERLEGHPHQRPRRHQQWSADHLPRLLITSERTRAGPAHGPAPFTFWLR